MKILFITPQLPYPPRQGTTIRNYNLIHYIADKHRVDLISFTAPAERLEASSPLHDLCRRVDTVPQPIRSTVQRVKDTFLSPLPDMGHRLESIAMHTLIEEWIEQATIEEWDFVQIEGIEVAQYGLQIIEGFRRRFPEQRDSWPKLIFDDHNCEYLLQKRNALNDLMVPKRWLGGIYSTLQWQKLRRYERMICLASATTLTVSVADSTALQSIAPEAEITVVYNGFDPPERLSTFSANEEASPMLLYIGKMDYRPNVDAMLWFGRSIFPLIREQIGNAQLKIVGMNPHPRLDELSSVAGIEITGMVEELGPYLKGAAVYVIPLRVGGGTRFKALEAMAYAKPIVTTSLGVEGIPVEDERDLLIADSADRFADAVVRLLHDIEIGGMCSQVLGQNAYDLVTATFTWPSIIPTLEEVYARCKNRFPERHVP